MKSSLIHIGIIITFAISGCRNQENPSDAQPKVFTSSGHVEIPANVIAELRKAVIDELKDPNSALFKSEEYFAGGVRVDKRFLPTRYSLCGKINAKNSYGGYTGASPFVAFLIVNEKGDISESHASIFEDPDKPFNAAVFKALQDSFCKNIN